MSVRGPCPGLLGGEASPWDTGVGGGTLVALIGGGGCQVFALFVFMHQKQDTKEHKYLFGGLKW